ncbi:MAG: hypothetical protein AB7S62_09900 [Azoarcus sp.]
MFSNILQRFWRKKHSVSVLCLLLLAMVLRGMVPAGYMPNLGEKQHGDALLTFCSHDPRGGIPDALLALWADVDLEPDPGDSDMSHSSAFCVLGQLTMDLPETGSLDAVAVFFQAQPVLPVTFFFLPLQGPRGPPLGSRAPPSFIV